MAIGIVMKKESAAEIERIQTFLREWDPLTVMRDAAEAADLSSADLSTEYDSYAPAILGMLLRGCSPEDIANYLKQVQVESMEVTPVEEKDLAVASSIFEWWQGRAVRM